MLAAASLAADRAALVQKWLSQDRLTVDLGLAEVIRDAVVPKGQASEQLLLDLYSRIQPTPHQQVREHLSSTALGCRVFGFPRKS